jgi:Fe-S oxidoreductase
MVTKEISHAPSFNETFFSSLYKLENGQRFRTCLQCGSCSGVCPFGYLMDFPPGRMIAGLRAEEFELVMKTDTVWMCVSCYACSQICPSKIPITAGLMTRTKEELLLAGNVPSELQSALENSQRYGNPLGESPRKRADWTIGIQPQISVLGRDRRPVDVLWFVGDYPSYHPRVQLVAKSLAKILNAMNINFGILGPDENSDGDTQRLSGERGLFEMLAEKNGKAFSRYQFNSIITSDPHAYNAIKNEYPSLGINYPVQHYTEFLSEHLDQLKPLIKQEIKSTVTYHDPCYLGRVNSIFEQPRKLLEAIPGIELIEMAHNHASSLCCGGGGGGMWLDGFQWEKAHVRLSEWRVREAVDTGADILAVACPYEPPRFEDAIKMTQQSGKLVVKDIAELIADALG